MKSFALPLRRNLAQSAFQKLFVIARQILRSICNETWRKKLM